MPGEYGLDLSINFPETLTSTEEAIFVHPDAVHKLSFKRYDPEAVDFGSTQFPLDLYGTSGNYKPFDPTGPSNDEILDILKR